MVTKQQQLEWLAKHWDAWMVDSVGMVGMSRNEVGEFGITHWISDKEWQQERDKMSSKPEVDSSWHERGELPPVGCECEALYRGEWVTVTIIGIDSSGYCVFEVPEHMNDGTPYDGLRNVASFSPLRTEREKAIDEMIKLIGHCYMSAEMAKELAIKMYDAGFHK